MLLYILVLTIENRMLAIMSSPYKITTGYLHEHYTLGLAASLGIGALAEVARRQLGFDKGLFHINSFVP